MKIVSRTGNLDAINPEWTAECLDVLKSIDDTAFYFARTVAASTENVRLMQLVASIPPDTEFETFDIRSNCIVRGEVKDFFKLNEMQARQAVLDNEMLQVQTQLRTLLGELKELLK